MISSCVVQDKIEQGELSMCAGFHKSSGMFVLQPTRANEKYPPLMVSPEFVLAHAEQLLRVYRLHGRVLDGLLPSQFLSTL